jgi:hypothetical protein
LHFGIMREFGFKGVFAVVKAGHIWPSGSVISFHMPIPVARFK